MQSVLWLHKCYQYVYLEMDGTTIPQSPYLVGRYVNVASVFHLDQDYSQNTWEGDLPQWNVEKRCNIAGIEYHKVCIVVRVTYTSKGKPSYSVVKKAPRRSAPKVSLSVDGGTKLKKGIEAAIAEYNDDGDPCTR